MSNIELMKKAICQHAIDQLEGFNGFDNTCDLHNELYNMDYFIVGIYQAKQFLNDSVFDVIETIKEYESFNFGEVSTDFSSPEKIVNMYAYIIGEELLNNCETLSKNWDKMLDSDDIKQIIYELEQQI